MAHTKSALKRIKTSRKSQAANKSKHTAMKSAMKRILTAEPGTLTVAQVADAMRLVDKAGKDGVIHKNAASRRKGQLDRALAAKKAAKK